MRLKCQALNMHGRRCDGNAKFVCHYHGDGEQYLYGSTRPKWVRVFLCTAHAKEMLGKQKLRHQWKDDGRRKAKRSGGVK